MKIAIMTWFHQDNYGTVLQAGALTHLLRDLGHEADIIRYFPRDTVYTVPDRAARKSALRFLRNARREEKDPVIVSSLAGESFADFRDNYLTMTDYCATMTDLERLNEQYDAFICGSDLIWLPRYFDPHFYLDFVRDPERMIAYAPSLLDTGSADRHVLEQMGELIRRFSHLSVREGSGRRILDTTFEIQTEEVADPVLMLSAPQWEQILADFHAQSAALSEPYAEQLGDAEAENADEALFEDDSLTFDTLFEHSSDEEAPAADMSAADSPDEVMADKAADAASEENADPAHEDPFEDTREDSEAGSTADPAGKDALREDTLHENTDDTAADMAVQPEVRPSGYLLECFQGNHFLYREAAQKLAERLGLTLKIIPIHQNDLDRPECIHDVVSPLDFVEWIRGASYVCTDSYHASCLALLFERELCCFDRYTERGEQERNARIHAILDTVGLNSRLYDAQASLENYLNPIDWIPVNYKLDALRLKSDKYLTSSLREVELHVNRTRPEHPHVLEGYTLCSGCGACAAVCPQQAVSIAQDARGFLRADINEELCLRCGQCTQVCPLRGRLTGQRIASGQLLSYTDQEAELSDGAAAGGMATRLAHILYDQGIAVAGCVCDEADGQIRHILVKPDEGRKNIDQMKGIKQGQSRLDRLWQQLSAYDGPAAIFGTPCQISAIRSTFADRDNLYYIDLVCEGVPSVLLQRKYQSSAHKKRFFIFGRPVSPDSMERIAALGGSLMESCYECRWRDTSQADLRIGDLRTDFEGRRGAADASLAICLTDRGSHLLKELMTAGYWEGLKKEDIVAYINTHPARNPIKPVFYDDLMRMLTDDKVSINRILGEYVKPLERRQMLFLRDNLYYDVGLVDSAAVVQSDEAAPQTAQETSAENGL